MAKSIRSKIKRKARSEFRATIGNEFYQKNMKKIQAKLKECAQSQTMSEDSLKRLTSALHTSTANDSTEDEATMMDSTSILTDELAAAKEYKGENVAPTKGPRKKSKKSKHKKPTTEPKKEKKRPRYFVQF